MKLKFFDLEVFPEWWCCVVSDEEDEYLSSSYKYKFTSEEEQKIKSKMRIYTSDDKDSVEKLKADITKGVASGYNIKGYDLIVLKGIFMHFTPHQVYVLSDCIIHPEHANKSVEYMRISNYARGRYQGCEAIQDLMDDSVKGLKDKEASFGMDIRETTVPFDKIDLTTDEKEQILFYCKHDVFALHVQYICMTKPYIDTKLSLCKTYDMPEKLGYESTNAVLSGKVLGAERTHGTTVRDPSITIYQPKLREYIETWVPTDVLTHLLNKQEALTKIMFDNIVSMGDGGLHSVYDVPKVGRETGKLYVEATEEYGLYNIDVSSCYPSCMIFGGAMSRAAKYADRFEALFKRRLQLKLTPKSEWTEDDKTFVPAAKLVLNTTYGAMGNKYLPLYDDYMRSKTCRLGQLILIAVAHDICHHVPELKVIQTNTDGILVYCKRSSLDTLLARVHNFEQLSGFTFEVEEDKKIWQLNVNNYIAEGEDGKLKLKGEAFVTEVWQRGTNRLRPLGMHIIAKAQIESYIHNANPIEYLLANTNVADLCLTCTKGPSYSTMIQKNIDKTVEVGKVGRVIAVVDATLGPVKKIKYNSDGSVREDTCAGCPDHALVLNDSLDNYEIIGDYKNRKLKHKLTNKEWTIDYGFYVDELERALNIPWFALINDRLSETIKFRLA